MNYVMELHFWQTMIMTVVAMAQFHFFYYATKQIATGLGIRIFRAKKVKVPKVNKKDKWFDEKKLWKSYLINILKIGLCYGT